MFYIKHINKVCLSEKVQTSQIPILKDENSLTNETTEQILDAVNETKKKTMIPPIKKNRNSEVNFEPTSPISPEGQSFTVPLPSIKNGKKNLIISRLSIQ